jgi:hypothetical protein
MYVIYSSSDNFKLVFYTLGIGLDVLFRKEIGRIATGTLLSLIEHGVIERMKGKLIKIHSESEVELTDEEFFAFCILVDFVSRCMISDVLRNRIKSVHEMHPFDTGSTFEQIVEFYLPQSTQFFEEIKTNFADDLTMIKAIEMATNWDWEDRRLPI